MRILAIESSCDETSAAVVEKNNDKITVLSGITATSLAIHAKTGGIIPENAAREQVKYIMPVIEKALRLSLPAGKAGVHGLQFTARDILENDIDAIAVTYGPGLIGSLLVGVETIKTLAYVFNKPVIPVNHLLAHLFANFIENEAAGRKLLATNKARSQMLEASSFPFIGLIVSGGHTDLLYFKNIEEYEWLGGTKDDAAGEALDKTGRLLGLEYPAGAEIEQRAKLGSKTNIRFKSPIINEETFDFSFSGLKTEVMRYAQDKLTVNREQTTNNDLVNEICFAVQKAVLDVLVKKTLTAAEKYNCKTILLGGGVSANQTLLEKFKLEASSQKLEANIFSPEKKYCTDNGAMIGAYALLNYKPKDYQDIHAEPDLYFD